MQPRLRGKLRRGHSFVVTGGITLYQNCLMPWSPSYLEQLTTQEWTCHKLLSVFKRRLSQPWFGVECVCSPEVQPWLWGVTNLRRQVILLGMDNPVSKLCVTNEPRCSLSNRQYKSEPARTVLTTCLYCSACSGEPRRRRRSSCEREDVWPVP